MQQIVTDKTDTDNFLYKDLSYKLRGIFFKVANSYGLGLKEKLYHQAIIDELTENKIAYEHENQLEILSQKDGRKIGLYIPDFVIENKIILEIKSEPFIRQQFYSQTYSYLRVSSFELGFIVNFGDEQLTIRRLLFTNDRKPHLQTK